MIRKQFGLIALWLLTAVAFSQQASTIKDIVIRGNQRVSKEAILGNMRTKVGRPYSQDDLDQDKRSLEELGFFSAVDIRATPVDLNAYLVTVDLQEWPVIKEFRITGNTVVPTSAILKVLTMKVGDVYNLNARRTSSDAIELLYGGKAYLANVDVFEPLPESPGTINIHILESRIEQILVKGNTHTKDWVMRRLIKSRAGDVYNEAKWTQDLRHIHNTQWFESVQGRRERSETEPGKIDLIADVKEGRTGQFNVGVQLDPQSSLAGIIRLSESNLYGTGQTVSLNFTQAITIVNGGPSIDLGYINPFYDAKDTTFQASVYSRLTYRFGTPFLYGLGSPTNGSTYSERRTGTSIGFVRPINTQWSVGVSTKVEDVITYNSGAIPLNSFILQDGWIAMGGVSAIRDRRDVTVDSSRGDYLKLNFEPGYSNIDEVGGATDNRAILGPNVFLRNSVELREYWSPGQKPRGTDFEAPRRVLAARVKYGWIDGQVPYWEQFFAGGPDTLRGYDPDRFWGDQTLLMTLEYRYPIQKAFNIIPFVDYGGAWGGYGAVNDYYQSPSFRLHIGYGAGLSFRTQFGLIRVDLGFNENGTSVPDFLIGNTF